MDVSRHVECLVGADVRLEGFVIKEIETGLDVIENDSFWCDSVSVSLLTKMQFFLLSHTGTAMKTSVQCNAIFRLNPFQAVLHINTQSATVIINQEHFKMFTALFAPLRVRTHQLLIGAETITATRTHLLTILDMKTTDKRCLVYKNYFIRMLKNAQSYLPNFFLENVSM